MRAVAQSADGATLLKQRTLALWVAQNRLAAAQLASPWPALGLARRRRGRRRARASSGAKRVSGTPNPAFRKIEIVVADPAQPDYVLARLVGLSRAAGGAMTRAAAPASR